MMVGSSAICVCVHVNANCHHTLPYNHTHIAVTHCRYTLFLPLHIAVTHTGASCRSDGDAVRGSSLICVEYTVHCSCRNALSLQVRVADLTETLEVAQGLDSLQGIELYDLLMLSKCWYFQSNHFLCQSGHVHIADSGMTVHAGFRTVPLVRSAVLMCAWALACLFYYGCYDNDVTFSTWIRLNRVKCSEKSRVLNLQIMPELTRILLTACVYARMLNTLMWLC